MTNVIEIPGRYRYECPSGDLTHARFTIAEEGEKQADLVGYRCSKCMRRLQKVDLATGDIVLGELTYEQ